VANFYDPNGHIPFGKGRVEAHLIDAAGKVLKIAARSKTQAAKTLLGWMQSLGKDPSKTSKNLF
jgi:hypothetical protein